MKNILKSRLTITIITLLYILLFTTNVNATELLKFDVVEITNNTIENFAYDIIQADVTSYNIGNLTFGEEKEIVLRITSAIENGVPNKEYGFYLDDTSTDSSNSANRYDHLHLYLPLSDDEISQRIIFDDAAFYRIKIDKASVGNFAQRTISFDLIFETNYGNVSFRVEGQDTKLILSEPVTNPDSPLVYNGSEQTMPFYILNSGIYDDSLFTGVNPSIEVSGNTGTDAGFYTATIRTAFTNSASWDPSLNIFGKYNDTILVQWEIKKKVETLSGMVYNGLANNKLSTVDLPEGWDWVNPTTSLKVGTNTYEAIYTPSDTNNYEIVRENITVSAASQYSIKFDLTEYGETDASSDTIYLEKGKSGTYEITSLSGYQFTSIKINNVEQLLNGQKVMSMPINIDNIDGNYEIIATTERIITIPEQGYDNLTIDVINNNVLEIKFPGDFASFKPKEVSIDGKVITTGFSFKEGSIIMILEESLLSTLTNGDHNIKITLEDNSLALASFNVTGSKVVETEPTVNPLTEDNVVISSIAAVISLLGVATTIMLRKKSKL